MESNTQNPNPTNRTILVKGLPINCTEREIFLFFRYSEGYERCYFKMSGNEKVALAIFNSRENAAKAVKQNNGAMFDITLKIFLHLEFLEITPASIKEVKPPMVGNKRSRPQNFSVEGESVGKKMKTSSNSGGGTYNYIPYGSTTTLQNPPLQQQSLNTQVPNQPFYGTTYQYPYNPQTSGNYVSYAYQPQSTISPPKPINPYQNTMMQQSTAYYPPQTQPQTSFQNNSGGTNQYGNSYKPRRKQERYNNRNYSSKEKKYPPRKPCCTLWIANLGKSTSQEEFQSHVTARNCVGVRKVKVMRDGSGVAFISFENLFQSAQAILNLNGSFFKGMKLVAEYAKNEMKP